MGQALKGACIIGQSGGPTAVINASVYGLVRAAQDSPHITQVYAAAHGIRGVLDDVLYDLQEESPQELDLLRQTPSAALGSCRYRLLSIDEDEADYRRILEIFKKYGIRYFFYVGGNDSMDTCNKIDRYLKEVGYECRILGVPKTIDNDLAGTDHCPGYGSAAKYIATACMEVYRDLSVYDTPTVCVMEVMGRHAGWLTAAAALASRAGEGPDLIYLPEVEFDMERFLADVGRICDERGHCFAAVSEGIHDHQGKLITEIARGESKKDAFGHKQLGGLAAVLAQAVKQRWGVKVRGIELSLLQRCAAHCASATDVEEAQRAGCAAVEHALAGESGKMVGFVREQDEAGGYRCGICLLDLGQVANLEKKLPLEWINAEGNGINAPYFDYALPLIQGEREFVREGGLPRFARLKKVRARVRT